MIDGFATFNQHFDQCSNNDQQVGMISTGTANQQITIEMAEKSQWIDIQHFALARQNFEHGLDAI